MIKNMDGVIIRLVTRSKSASLARTIIVVDVVGFTDPDRKQFDKLAVREGMYDVLETAFAESGLDFDTCEHEDRGDGALILLPLGAANGVAVDRLPERIVVALRRYNSTRTPQAQFKLRMSMNSGEVVRDGHGWVGTAVDVAFRILEAPEAKSALAQTDQMIAFISSERFFGDVIDGDAGLAPESYLQIAVSVKQFSGTAYLRLLGGGMPPAQVPVPLRGVLVREEVPQLAVTMRRALGPALGRRQIASAPIADQSRPQSTILLGNVPPRNPNFTGRDELLKQLGMRLTSGTTAVLPSALQGLGGLGKTQLATEYLYRHLQDYDLVCWIDAAHTTQIRAGLAKLAQALGLPGAVEAGVVVPTVLEALRIGRPFRRWLLVFDAAESPDAVLPFFPRNGPGEILITSRNYDWAGIAWPLELPVFKRAESIELLGRRGPEINEADADLLAEKLGDLPLAIEQAAAWRAVTGMPVQEYLRLFDESVAEILDTVAAPYYEVSVAAAWSVSFEELRTRNPAAYQILLICAFFSPEPISRDLFTGVRWVSISPELDAALGDPIKLARAIRDINRYGFAKIDHGNNTLQLHRLVQLILRNRVMSPEVHAQMKHGAHQLLAALDPNDPESSRHWPRYRELLPHAYAAGVADCDDSWPRQVSINLMRYLFEYGDYEEAVRLATETREHFAETLGPTHEHTLAVSSRLGLYLWAVGRYGEAAELNRRTLALRLQVSVEENEEIFALQRNIAVDRRVEGDFVAGATLSGEIYHKSKRMFGEDDPETLNAAFQHGLSLRFFGDYRAAAELDEDTWIRRIEVLGRDHPRTFSVHASLIIDCREAGEYRRALVMQEEVTEHYRTRFGPEDPGTTVHELYLSIARRKDGDHNGALSLSGACLERFRLMYGEDHACTRASALAHSIDLRYTGDLAEAWQLGRVTSERHRMRLGEHHPHTLAASVDFAVTLRHLGDVERAREVDERALEHLRAGTGPDHPYAVVAAINLASDLSRLGDLDQAIELGSDAIERGGRILGSEHPTVLAAAFNLGLDLEAAGYGDKTKPYQEPILNKYRKVLGEAHPGTQAAIRGERADCDIDPMLM